MPITVNYLYDNPDIAVGTEAEVEHLLDQIRDKSRGSDSLMMIITVAGDPFSQVLEAGVNGDTGFVRYASATPHQALISQGSDSEDGDVLYYFQDNQHEIPASVELPYPQVVAAVQEFLREPGEPPASISWQPVP
jgi:hypothetical protein